MIRINLCVWVVLASLLFGCSGKVENNDNDHVVVVGTAYNLKSGAGVISNEEVYYLDSVDSWDENMLEKRVVVEGELFVEILPPLPPRPEVGPNDPPPPPPPQRIPDGFMLIIKNPKW